MLQALALHFNKSPVLISYSRLVMSPATASTLLHAQLRTLHESHVWLHVGLKSIADRVVVHYVKLQCREESR